MHRITGFLDFFHRPIFYRVENTTFRKLDLFPSSGEGREDTYSVGPLRANPSPEDGNRSSFRNVVFSIQYNTGRWKKFKNPIILCVIHYRQNSLESAYRCALHHWELVHAFVVQVGQIESGCLLYKHTNKQGIIQSYESITHYHKPLANRNFRLELVNFPLSSTVSLS
jgi:hypothetical protein